MTDFAGTARQLASELTAALSALDGQIVEKRTELENLKYSFRTRDEALSHIDEELDYFAAEGREQLIRKIMGVARRQPGRSGAGPFNLLFQNMHDLKTDMAILTYLFKDQVRATLAALVAEAEWPREGVSDADFKTLLPQIENALTTLEAERVEMVLEAENISRKLSGIPEGMKVI